MNFYDMSKDELILIIKALAQKLSEVPYFSNKKAKKDQINLVLGSSISNKLEDNAEVELRSPKQLQPRERQRFEKAALDKTRTAIEVEKEFRMKAGSVFNTRSRSKLREKKHLLPPKFSEGSSESASIDSVDRLTEENPNNQENQDNFSIKEE